VTSRPKIAVWVSLQAIHGAVEGCALDQGCQAESVALTSPFVTQPLSKRPQPRLVRAERKISDDGGSAGVTQNPPACVCKGY
jgi:hypothetical protein